MKTATLEITENLFLGEKPHEASFNILTLEDGTTAPLGRLQRVAVTSKEAALQWAKENNIRIVQGERKDMRQDTQPEIGGLVRINGQDPRAQAHGQVGRLISKRSDATNPNDPCYLVDFGLRGSLVVNGKHFDAYESSI